MRTSTSEGALNVIIGYLTSATVYLIGGVDKLFGACAVFVVLDYITGVIAAWYNKELSSYTGFRGIAKKVAMFVFVIIGHQLDVVVGNSEHFMRDAVLMFIIGTEGISILENLNRMGVEVPRVLMQSLERVSGEKRKRPSHKRDTIN